MIIQHYQKRKTPYLIAVILMLAVFSSAVQAISFDVRGEYESWNSGLSGTSTAMLVGVGGSHAIDAKTSIGGGFVTGKYNTDSEAETDISRFDLDITASYLIRPLISVFAGYQLIQLNYENRDDSSRSFDDTLHGFGIGAVSYFPIKPQWLLYGGVSLSGVYAISSPDSGGEDKGAGYSNSLNGGVLYALKKNMSITTGLKTRWTSIDYWGDAGKWSHNAVRLVVSFSRQW